ncbi:alpha/beta-hydrolase [Stipitochalara longipes BDJ]|nr:alpha/beta-hydrolase [Stipitochalara longipes BDJ]
MGSLTLLAAMALAACVSATPVVALASNDLAGLADHLPSYITGFKNPSIVPSVGGKALCVSGTVDVTASATNYEFLRQASMNQTELTELLLDDTVHVLTHGIGIDHTYWNNAPNYSYVDYAAEQGYTIFNYDRLGVGLSDHPDPLQVVQAELEIAIAHGISELLRSGAFAAHKFEKVVAVGHSFDSIVTYGWTKEYPHDMDAAVLTGFSPSVAGAASILIAQALDLASVVNPILYSELPAGYITSSTITGIQFSFFRWPAYDEQLFYNAWENAQPLTLPEFLSGASILASPNTNFTGPVDVVDGEHDQANCAGNCQFPVDQTAAAITDFYPAASKGSDHYIAPGSGHFVNYHYAATGAYEHIHKFLKKNNI